MKNECNIVRDLLPLCIEDMASPDSAVFVGKHLETCEDCRREMSRLQAPDLSEQPAPDPAEAEDFFVFRQEIQYRNRVLVSRRTLISTVIICALLISLIAYHLPQHRRVSIPVCSTTGEATTLQIDVKYYRRLFSTPWVEGTVTFDGVVYRDYHADLKAGNVEEHGSNSSFWGWDFCLPPVNDLLPDNMRFVKIPSSTDVSDYFSNSMNNIIFMGAKDSDAFRFDKVMFFYLDESNKTESGSIPGILYAGPAATPEEARQITEEYGYTFD